MSRTSIIVTALLVSTSQKISTLIRDQKKEFYNISIGKETILFVESNMTRHFAEFLDAVRFSQTFFFFL